MEPNIKNKKNIQNQEDSSMSKSESNMQHSTFAKIIIFIIALTLSLALGYFLYSQLLSKDPSEVTTETSDLPGDSGFNAATFDEKNVSSRENLLRQMSDQEPSDEEQVSLEQRQALLEAVSDLHDEESDAKMSIEQRQAFLQAVSDGDVTVVE